MLITPEEGYQQFINILWDNIKRGYALLLKPKYKLISSRELNTQVNSVFPGLANTNSDFAFKACDWKTWENFITADWTNRKKYIVDYFDCDNYSDAFRAHAAELLDLNTAGKFGCSVITDKGEVIPHRAVLIVATDENDKLACYVFESQTDGWQKVEKGKPIRIGTWSYNALSSAFN
jgi:hypothetical protein